MIPRKLTNLFLSIIFVLFLFPILLSAEPSSEYGKIVMMRDKWGVPHIFSDTDAGAMYGLGYATAEDRAFQMYYSLRIIQGRAAEVLGNVSKKRRDRTALTEDIKMRTFGFYRYAKEVAANLDLETLSLLQAYSEGVNDYISQNQDGLLYLFEKYEIEPESWTPADCIVSWWHLGKFFAKEGLHDTMVYHRMKDEGKSPDTREDRSTRGRGRVRRGGRDMRDHRVYDDAAAVVKRDDVSDEWIQKINEFMKKYDLEPENSAGEEGLKFSHAWVVGGKKSTTDSSILCSDPQTRVRNPSMFYEFHIQGKTFNVRGLGVPGSPVILIGWNDTVAWGMTALGADQADQFLLKTDPEHPNQYYFDGEWWDMRTWRETIKVRDGEDKTITLKETHLGPVVTPIAHDIRRGEEVALKRVPFSEKNRDTIQGALAMIRAKNADEFKEGIKGWRFPSANCVFGDKDGNIAYWTVGAIPVRSPHALSGGRASHKGTASKFDWQGYVPYDLLPHIINPDDGYLFSANHRPIASFYTIPIGLSTGIGGDTDRSWRLRERLSSKENFSPKDVLDIHYDCVNPAKREIVHLGYYLLEKQKTELNEETKNTLRYLKEWYEDGAKSDMAVKGTEVVNLIPTMFRIVTTDLALKYGGGSSGLCYFLKTVKERLQNDPDAKLNETEIEFIDQSLTRAWQNAGRQYGRNSDEWHKRAKEKLQRQKMGYFVSLDGFPSLDPKYDLTFPKLSCIDHGTILSQEGQSYSQWVPLHDIDSAKSILPIGHSEHPNDPFRKSTYDLWSEGEFHPAPISREAVEEIAVNTEVLSE